MTLKEKVDNIIEKVRPALQADGGGIELVDVLEDEGVDLLTVHGRLHGEKFCRKARWDWIAKVKNGVNIPVLANGGIFTVEDARKCFAESGADGLMLGRGAAIRPWLFADNFLHVLHHAFVPAVHIPLSLPDTILKKP